MSVEEAENDDISPLFLSTLEPAIMSATPVPDIDFSAMAAEQLTDPLVLRLRQDPGSLQLSEVPCDGVTLLCDLSTGRPRPIVPPAFTKQVFDCSHALLHSGPKPTKRAVCAKFVWPHMKRDIQRWCKECHDCNSSKISRHARAPLENFSLPDRRFGEIHVDLVGPLPPSEGQKYIYQ